MWLGMKKKIQAVASYLAKDSYKISIMNIKKRYKSLSLALSGPKKL